MKNSSFHADRLPFDPGPPAWKNILPPNAAFQKLDGDQTADFVIVGGGFAGLSAARRLRQLDSKAKIAVLEARSIAEGPAGRNSGFMIDLPHKLASKDYAGNLADDRAEISMNREAIAFASDVAGDYGMSDEAFTISGKVNAAATEKGTHHNRNYAAHLATLGEAHEMMDAAAMSELCGSKYYQSGLFTPGTAMLQPALYIQNLANGLAQQGVQIFENSPVDAIQREGASWRVSSGAKSISAGNVILTVNGHAESFGFFRRRLMHIYLYASMTRPLTENEMTTLGGSRRWGLTPADPLGTTVRRISGTGGDRIVVRNRFTWAPERTVDEAWLNRVAGTHVKSFKNRFPHLAQVEMEYRWGGLLCLSRNASPAFGKLEEGLYSACCQNGLGTAMGTLAGKLVAEFIAGRQSASLSRMLAYAPPSLLPPEPFASIGANAVMRWKEFRAGAEL